MISLENVSKRFGSLKALDSIQLALPPRKTTALIGPSGCGKSTILRSIIGLVVPDSGKVRVDGIPISPENLASMRRKMGYVIQEGGLFPHLSAYGNLSLMPKVLGWSSNKIRARIQELSELTHFPPSGLDRFPNELSGGQRQRVSLMRALVLDPQILLLDEPMGALDPMIRRDLQNELREIFRKLGKTVVLVTHDLVEAGFLGDSVVLMREGKIAQKGMIADLIQNPADDFVSRFVNAQRNPIEEGR